MAAAVDVMKRRDKKKNGGLAVDLTEEEAEGTTSATRMPGLRIEESAAGRGRAREVGAQNLVLNVPRVVQRPASAVEVHEQRRRGGSAPAKPLRARR